MRRRAPLLAVVALAACPGPGASPKPSVSPRGAGNGWNVLLITIDTLRADHLGAYGYDRATSPRLDAFARRATLFEQAYSFWPKTRGSFVVIHTGRPPCRSGYDKGHPGILGFNPTLASVLKEAGYATAAIVDNPNVAAQHGYNKGFDSYREVWEEHKGATEVVLTRAITEAGTRFLLDPPRGKPFLLWLHYVNPHAPYTPPPPFDTAFLDARAQQGPRLPVVGGNHGGIPKPWAVSGKDRLGYYVAQYDGEIATADQEVGKVLDALHASSLESRTVVLVTSDHGESLGEHDYFFDHGEDLFDPSLRIPLIVAVPGTAAGRRSAALASTLDFVPTILDAVKVSYPPDLSGISLLPAVSGGALLARDRLFGANDRNLAATWGTRFKLVATPADAGRRLALYDRQADPSEMRDASRAQPDRLRVEQRELELSLDHCEKEWTRTRRLVGDAPAKTQKMSPEACEKLRALGYVLAECEP